MSVTASDIFAFLERQTTGSVERHEIASAAFGSLRRNLRQIVLRLRDSDDQEALETSDRLRAALSEWLTVPIPFDQAIPDAITELLGEAQAVQTRWGKEIRALYDAAVHAARELPSVQNPVRDTLHTVIRQLRAESRSFKVYCHRRAKPYFDSIFSDVGEPPLLHSEFLHSVRDYRDTEPFDVLIKVGPFRTRGWGSAPDAFFTAPRFATIVQVVWFGCGDETGFGYDPVSPAAGGAATSTSSTENTGSISKWTKRIVTSGEDPGADTEHILEMDELRVFKEMNQPRDKRSATLVQIDGEHGILYPPHSQVISFDSNPASLEPICRRIPGETLVEGMYLIWPVVEDIDFGGVQAEHGHYSRLWKERLEQEMVKDASALAARLRADGLNLLHLRAAMGHWCEPPTTVIHAPQQMKHFEILIKALGLEDQGRPSSRTPLPWWRLAWAEIRRSRGEAIQAGVQEQEIIDAQLIDILASLTPHIRDAAANGKSFPLPIPEGRDVKGQVLFLKVHGVEDGYSVPETEIRVLRELNVIELWRD